MPETKLNAPFLYLMFGGRLESSSGQSNYIWRMQRLSFLSAGSIVLDTSASLSVLPKYQHHLQCLIGFSFRGLVDAVSLVEDILLRGHIDFSHLLSFLILALCVNIPHRYFITITPKS